VLPEAVLSGKGGNPAANRVRLASPSWLSAQNYRVVTNPLNAAFLQVILQLKEVTSVSLCGQKDFFHIVSKPRDLSIGLKHLFVNMPR